MEGEEHTAQASSSSLASVNVPDRPIMFILFVCDHFGC